MARRKDHTRQELKNLCIKEGYNILKTEGLKEFSARKVARGIGYTIGTVYNVFGTHENLMLNIQGAILDDWFEALGDDCGENPTVHELASFYIYYARKHYQTWSLLFVRPATQKDETPEWYREKFTRLFAVVEKSLLPHVGGNAAEAAHHAHLLWASLHGICTLAVMGKLDLLSQESAEAMAHRLVDTYLKGLKT